VVVQVVREMTLALGIQTAAMGALALSPASQERQNATVALVLATASKEEQVRLLVV
jgi:hypothetical protein